MIKLQIPVDKIIFARQIEGRVFKEGFWFFPDTSLGKLKELKLIDNDIEIKEKETKQYELSNHLRKYQKIIVNNALNDGSYGIFSDTGTGKTIMGIEIAKNYNKVLIICPLSVIQTAWIDDCNKFYPDLEIESLWDKNKRRRLEKLNTDSQIYVINYEGLKLIYNDILKAGFDCIIVDESSKMKNHKSQISQLLLKLSEHIEHRFILSGCPCPNHNSEIFAQSKFINPNIFGNNYYGFLAKYFHQDMANPHKWYQTDEDKDRFFNKLNQQCTFLKKDDCVDLPEKTFLIRQFDLHKEQKRYYNDIINDINKNINNWSKFKFKSKLIKLREVLSGFLIDKESIIDFKSNKEVELMNVIEEVGDKPVIVWCQFIHEIEQLAKKFNGVALTSKTKNRDQIINDFKNNKIKLLFAHPKLIGMGVTLTNCNYNIYYSLSFSYEEFKQSQDRIHRIGQENKCTYIILQAQNTIDEKIYSCLNNKKSIVDELYNELSLNSN